MEYNEFMDYIKKAVEEQVEGTVDVINNVKNNNTGYAGLIVKREDCNISPTINLDVFFRMYEEQGRTLHSIADEIVSIYNDTRVQESIDVSVFTDWDKVRGHVAFKLVNYEENRELLQNVPYTGIFDLAKVFYIVYRSDRHESVMSVLVSHEMMNMWKIDKEELEQCAESNTPELLPVIIERVSDVLQRLGCIEGMEQWNTDANEHLYVVSNQTGCMGAGAILYEGVLENLADRMGVEELYIIPSSIHEVLVTDDLGNMDLDELRKLVESVNGTINREDVLSGNLYYYEREKDRIVIAAM